MPNGIFVIKQFTSLKIALAYKKWQIKGMLRDAIASIFDKCGTKIILIQCLTIIYNVLADFVHNHKISHIRSYIFSNHTKPHFDILRSVLLVNPSFWGNGVLFVKFYSPITYILRMPKCYKVLSFTKPPLDHFLCMVIIIILYVFV